MGEDVGKSEPALAAGNVKWCSCCRKQRGGSSAAIESRNPTFGHTPKRMQARTQIDICAPMFTAAWFTIAKRGRNPGVFWWMSGQAEVGCTHRGIFSRKKQGDSETGHHMDAP